MDHAILLMNAAQESASQIILAAPDIPDPGNGSAPPGVGDAFEDVMGWAKWVALGLVVLGLIATGALMAINSRRGEGGELLGRLGWAMLGACIIAGAVSVVGFLVTASTPDEDAAGLPSQSITVVAEQVHTDG